MRKHLVIAAALSAATLALPAVSVGAASYEPGSQPANAEIEAFARALAASAASAEASALPGDASRVEHQVTTTLQELVVTAAKPPANVRLALQRVVYVCIRPAEVKRYTFSCPTTAAGMNGVRDVLTTVIALIEGSETAAAGGQGTAAIAAINPPPGGAGGTSADYEQLQQ